MIANDDRPRPRLIPFWPSRGFWGYCRYQIRDGLESRYWPTLPWMWHRELRFRREVVECLEKFGRDE